MRSVVRSVARGVARGVAWDVAVCMVRWRCALCGVLRIAAHRVAFTYCICKETIVHFITIQRKKGGTSKHTSRKPNSSPSPTEENRPPSSMTDDEDEEREEEQITQDELTDSSMRLSPIPSPSMQPRDSRDSSRNNSPFLTRPPSPTPSPSRSISPSPSPERVTHPSQKATLALLASVSTSFGERGAGERKRKGE